MSPASPTPSNGPLPRSSFAVAAAAVVGTLLPTSIAGDIAPRLTIVLCALCIALVAITYTRGRWLVHNVPLALLVLALFALFTATSPLPELAPGGLAPYALALAVMLVDTRGMVAGRAAHAGLMVINVVVLGLGVGTVLGVDALLGIVETYYKAFYDELFDSMIVWSAKPVAVYASHSIAAFAYFALLCLNLKLSRAVSSSAYRAACLLSAAGYLVLIPLLVSNTALALALPAFVIFGWRVLDRLSPWPRAILIAFVGVLGFRWGLEWTGFELDELIALINAVTSEPGGGLLGRYTAGGRLQPTYDYLLAYAFLPIGLTYAPWIALGDNFIAEYVLRLSPLGYLLILYILWAWTRRNVVRNSHCVGFIVFFLLADVGYPLLTYPRVAALMPLYALLWRSAERHATRQGA